MLNIGIDVEDAKDLASGPQGGGSSRNVTSTLLWRELLLLAVSGKVTQQGEGICGTLCHVFLP